MSSGFDEVAATQRAILDDFWERSDVQVDGDPQVQQAIRWNLFQLFQATARAEGSGVPAKGLTGHGYEGHYFWDIELFLLPFLCYTEPRIAKNLQTPERFCAARQEPSKHQLPVRDCGDGMTVREGTTGRRRGAQ
jgi:trehalose/maltose hydrolase-like predicted phosphorylase